MVEKKIEWTDPGTGVKYGVAYSTEVQLRLAKTMEENLAWRKKTYYVLNFIKWSIIAAIIIFIIGLTYLNSRNAVTVIGNRLFCGS
jgi:uncharacterized membrane protein YvbJ